MMRMTYKFLTYSPQEIRQTYNWEMYVFLLAIFVSLTNQVCIPKLLLLPLFLVVNYIAMRDGVNNIT